MGKQMSRLCSKFIVWPASFSMRHHSNVQRNPGLEWSIHISKQTACQLLTGWTINTSGSGLWTAIKGTGIDQRVLGTIRMCHRFGVLHPQHIVHMSQELCGTMDIWLWHIRPSFCCLGWLSAQSPWKHGRSMKAESLLNMEGRGQLAMWCGW